MPPPEEDSTVAAVVAAVVAAGPPPGGFLAGMKTPRASPAAAAVSDGAAAEMGAANYGAAGGNAHASAPGAAVGAGPGAAAAAAAATDDAAASVSHRSSPVRAQAVDTAAANGAATGAAETATTDAAGKAPIDTSTSNVRSTDCAPPSPTEAIPPYQRASFVPPFTPPPPHAPPLRARRPPLPVISDGANSDESLDSDPEIRPARLEPQASPAERDLLASVVGLERQNRLLRSELDHVYGRGMRFGGPLTGPPPRHPPLSPRHLPPSPGHPPLPRRRRRSSPPPTPPSVTTMMTGSGTPTVAESTVGPESGSVVGSRIHHFSGTDTGLGSPSNRQTVRDPPLVWNTPSEPSMASTTMDGSEPGSAVRSGDGGVRHPVSGVEGGAADEDAWTRSPASKRQRARSPSRNLGDPSRTPPGSAALGCGPLRHAKD
ncbi:hypothetical protein I4F81_006671 [Pyropia yezoensis]|uniref:Uncharacterized protein n=1 Tax=Pyropia yezoensis TaxID=2788 RepID=A0ACC3C1F9_PYRYE|nr:hypothetical protein I4F81_006671 [Neopyropia yezoensis]